MALGAEKGSAKRISDMDTALRRIDKTLSSMAQDISSLKNDVKELKQGQKALEQGQKALEQGQKALEQGQKDNTDYLINLGQKVDRIETTQNEKISHELERVLDALKTAGYLK